MDAVGRPARRGGLAVCAVVAALAAALPTTGAAATSAAATSASATSPAFVRPAGFAPGGPAAGAAEVGPLAPDATVDLDVVLAPTDPAGLPALLRSLDDPSSPDFHHWLTPGQFDRDFAPTPATTAAVESWLSGKGLAGTAISPFAIHVTAPSAAVARALGTSFEQYRSRSGADGYLASSTPLVPAALADGPVAGILGLNTTAPLRSDLARVNAAATGSSATGSSATGSSAALPHEDGLSVCGAAQSAAGQSFYTLDALGASYGMATLLDNGQTGHGVTVGAYELGASSATDISTYETCFGLTNPVSRVPIDGGAGVDAGATGEADADIEQVATQAPGAAIISYEGPNTATGQYDTWNAITTADAAQVVSTSWGECEPLAEAALNVPAFTLLFQQAAAQGQTVLASSGDSGSEDCFRELESVDPVDATLPTVDYPSSDDYVTAVGGTSRTANAETVWNSCQGQESVACANSFSGQAAGGGGLSSYEPELAGQPIVATWDPQAPAPCGTTCREVPDLSANAGVGMILFQNGTWGAFVGTSLSAPFVAGLVADHDEGCTATSGDWTSALYATAAAGSSAAFNDITTGDNDMTGSNGGAFPATPGYDAATGLGSPVPAGLSCAEVQSVGAGVAGQQVPVAGLGLEHATISFGSTAATVVSATATQATVVVPAGSGTVTVSASSALGRGVTTASFTYPAATGCVTSGPSRSASGTAVGVVATTGPNGCAGYLVVTRTGQVATFGDAAFAGDLRSTHVAAPIVGIAATPDHGGYWLVAADGGIFAFGDAAFYGSTGGRHLNAPIVGIAATPSGRGYWLVAADGGIFSFGDAAFYGSTGAIRLHEPIVGTASTADGHGYWLVAADGGIFAFGDAPFLGSMGAVVLNRPVVAMTAGGGGYRLVAADGGIFSFGAPFYGSLGGAPAGAPVTSMAPSVDGGGYYLLDQPGNVYAYGDATYFGSL